MKKKKSKRNETNRLIHIWDNDIKKQIKNEFLGTKATKSRGKLMLNIQLQSMQYIDILVQLKISIFYDIKQIGVKQIVNWCLMQ